MLVELLIRENNCSFTRSENLSYRVVFMYCTVETVIKIRQYCSESLNRYVGDV